jgi:hypothetical protein
MQYDGEMRTAYKVLVGKPQKEIASETTRRWEDNFKMDRCDSLYWNELANNSKIQQRVFMDSVSNFRTV